MKRRFISALTTFIAASFVVVPLASAHVVVTPGAAQTATRVTFGMSVPNEKDVPVTGLKLKIPAGLKEVTPTVHPGWTIKTTTTSGEVTAIEWTGGEIPAGQRDDFTLRAQTPEKAGELQWKVYQTYADGTTVAWDKAPTAAESESETAGPYSVTKVSEETVGTDTDTTSSAQNTSVTGTTTALLVSLVALIVAVVALLRPRRSL